MTGKDRLIVLILVAAIAAVAVALVATMPFGGNTGPVDPDDPVDPEPVSPYPEGISYDSQTGVLSSDKPVTWSVVDELREYADRVPAESFGDSVELSPGLYNVTVKGESFHVVMEGTHTDTVSWKYWFEGTYYDVQVTYDIDISELAELTLENRETNRHIKNDFSNLPSLVYVDDTVRSIVSQLADRFTEIGGDIADRQSYADFLVSFAQLAIEYPPIVDGSSDKEVWGVEEYWAKSLETLYFKKGDCEDSAAVACSLFMAAGYGAAMVGVHGHVTAAVALDGLEEVDPKEIASYNKLSMSLTLAEGTSVYETDPQDIFYYGVDTTKGQVPVGYMLIGSVKNIGKSTPWGTAGFYPVKSDR